jgi:hypothetical protein
MVSRPGVLTVTENAFKMRGIGCGKPEIKAGKARPFFGGSRLGVQEMGNGQTGAQHRPITAIEEEKPCGRILVQCRCQMSPDPFASPCAAQAFAFQVQKGNFVEGIEGPELRIEFEAVDDRQRRSQPNMFGSQIAMCIDVPSFTNSLAQMVTNVLQETGTAPA